MKKKAKQPNEGFSLGPIRFVRYGSTAVVNANWSKEEHAKMLKNAAEELSNLVSKIDELVWKVAEMVKGLPSDKLLSRAWWQLASIETRVGAERDFGSECMFSFRMVDYVQSVVASVEPSKSQKEDVSDEEWDCLSEKVGEIFRIIGTEYIVCLSAKCMTEKDDYDPFLDEFYVMALLYWCNVRGKRYQFHMIHYFNDMFLPYTKIFEELFSITSEEFVEGLRKIYHQQTFGLEDYLNDFMSFRDDTLDGVERAIEGGFIAEDVSLTDAIDTIVTENGWEERRESVVDRLDGLGLFDVGEVTGWPKKLLSELTWRPGEDGDFFSGDKFRGWPLRIWPTFKRPFIELDGRSCCFDLCSLSDNIYRVMQRICVRLKPNCRNEWNRIQKDRSEELPVRYFEQILPGATVYRSVYYRWFPNTCTHKKDWCEADALIVYDDCLFIVEVKAGAFTYTSPANDFPAFISSLKNLVQNPARQGERFFEYLESTDAVPLFDKRHNKIGSLHRDDFRRIVICPVSVDSFTEMTAQVQHLCKIGVNIGNHPVWAISLDDLRVYADVFENPLIFIHYVKQRMRAFDSDVVQLNDELDHLGLYQKHNNYAEYAEEIRGESDGRVTVIDYKFEIDKFFELKVQGRSTASPLMAGIPEHFFEVVMFISRSSKQHRTELSDYILDLNVDMREKVALQIESELRMQPESLRFEPFSVSGGVNITFCCYCEPFVSRDSNVALDHTKTVMLVQNDKQRLLVELVYDETGQIRDFFWRWVSLDNLSDADRERLQPAMIRLKRGRVSQAVAKNGKIGRNSPCPCGSGKKYKKCCLK